MFSRRYFLGGLTAASTLSWRSALGEPITFRMVYFGDFAPFSQVDANGRVRGLFVDAIDHILRDGLGLTVQHQAFPWARAQAMVRSGEADGFCTVPTPERSSYTLISQRSVRDAPVRIIAASDNPRLDELRAVRTLTDLRPFRIGKYIGSGWAEANLRPLGLSIQDAADLTGALRLVANGRVDAVVDGVDSMRLRLSMPEFHGKLLELPTNLDWQRFHLCVGMNSPHAGLMEQIDAVMASAPPLPGRNAVRQPTARASK